MNQLAIQLQLHSRFVDDRTTMTRMALSRAQTSAKAARPAKLLLTSCAGDRHNMHPPPAG